MKIKRVIPSPDVLDVLQQMEFGDSGDGVVWGRIHPQLEKDLYQEVAALLARMGGKWSMRRQRFTFLPGYDPRSMIFADRVEIPHDDFFRTLPNIVEMMLGRVDWSCVDLSVPVLEPSAGDGAICVSLIAKGIEPRNIHVCELNPGRARILQDAGYTFLGDDFMEVAPSPTYQLIFMNPPFNNMQAAKHMLHAFENHLAPGGQLVCLIPNGQIISGENELGGNLRGLVDTWGGKEWLPPKSFRKSGTDIDIMLVSATKPGSYSPGDMNSLSAAPWEPRESRSAKQIEYEDPAVIAQRIVASLQDALAVMRGLQDELGDCGKGQKSLDETLDAPAFPVVGNQYLMFPEVLHE